LASGRATLPIAGVDIEITPDMVTIASVERKTSGLEVRFFSTRFLQHILCSADVPAVGD
jgi:hypothetical protein